MGRPILFLAVLVVAWLLYKLYFKKFWNQGRQGRIKLGLISAGLVFVALALTGRAPALLALVGAAMTQIVRLAPLLIRFMPSLRSVLGTGAMGSASGSMGGGGPSISRVSTPTIDMTLDHASGKVDGDIKTGVFQGRRLSQLTLEELKALYAYCRKSDGEAMRLVLAYARRERASEWDSTAEQEGASDDVHSGRSGSMTLAEAREVLAVSKQASRQEIIDAHRSLMGRLHPDKGGSDYLAAQVNKAKDLLIKSLDTGA